MILTVTLNPAFDHLLFIPEVNLGKFNRAQSTIRMPGGKGVNVASSLAVMGRETIATGFLGGRDSQMFENSLRKIGVTTNFIYVDQGIRTDFFVIEEKKNRQSLIVEKGVPINLRYLNSFKENFERLLHSVELVEIGGSLPNGVAANFLHELVAMANKKKVKVVLNLQEPVLSEVMQGNNALIVCPDLRENKSLYGGNVCKPGGCENAAQELLKKGAEIVILKFGNLNYLVVSKDETWEAEIELGESSVMIGIRDAVLAGFIHKYLETQNIGEAIKFGLGAGRSTARNKMNYPSSQKETAEFTLMAKARKVA